MKAMVATRKGLFEFYRDQQGWHYDQISFLGDPVSMCLYDKRDGSIYAALNLGHFGVKLHRRAVNSRDWVEIAVPNYPERPADSPDKTEWKLTQIWSLACGGADRPGELWAGTLPGGLFRSSDGGLSWQLQHGLWDKPERLSWFGGGNDVPGMHSIEIDPRNSQVITVAVSCGGIWRSEDAGLSWHSRTKGMFASYVPPELAEDPNAQDPHSLSVCKTQPNVIWCQHHCGIWRSVDAGLSWQQIKTPDGLSDFGFNVVAHPRNPDIAWFVPMDSDQRRLPRHAALQVCLTRDAGKSFESFTQGLPQQHCYDLIYRHSFVIADDAEHALMGSTTGNLWASADGARSWQAIAQNLPPIYAVRFYQ